MLKIVVLVGALLAQTLGAPNPLGDFPRRGRSLAQIFGTGNMALHGSPAAGDPDGNFHAELNNTLLVREHPNTVTVGR